MSNIIDYLIISNKNDFTTDFVCIKLRQYKKEYLRINRDEFADYEIIWDINKNEMCLNIDGDQYVVNDSLKAVYYRAPVYTRYYMYASKEEQLYKSQWMAFVKNLLCFENAKWVNNPVATYKAENKMLQLRYAKQIGFNIPNTKVINCRCKQLQEQGKYIIKSIDTLLLRYEEKEAFLYSNIASGEEINSSDLSMSPVVIQDFLNPKIDLRVTVVDNEVYTVQILKSGQGTYDDWRKEKDNVEFIPYSLPNNLKQMCIALVKKFNLIYGAIDLAIVNNKYYFIEINPTGEWAWLVENPGFSIDEKITETLMEL